MNAVPDAVRLQNAAHAPDRPHLNLVNGADVELKPPRWLVPGWLAAGKLHVLGGAPGTGKTTIATAIGAMLTVGGRWPTGQRVPVGDVLIWSGEDSAEDTLIPRVVACGGNRARVYVVGDVAEPRPAGDTRRAFDPATDMGLLMEAAGSLPELRLVIVDPIVSAIAGDSHKNAEVRRGLAPLVELAERRQVAVLGITHLSKGSIGRDPVERLTGSLAFGALARVVMVAARLPNEDGDVRALLIAKNNIAPDSGGFRYMLRHDELDGHPGVVGGRIEWGAPIEGSARDVLGEAEALADGEASAGRSASSEAEDWLRHLLATGTRRAAEVFAEGSAAGFAKRTIQRAAERLRVVRSKAGMSDGWLWHLPAGGLPKVPADAKAPEDAEGAKVPRDEQAASSPRLAPEGAGCRSLGALAPSAPSGTFGAVGTFEDEQPL